MRFSRNQESHLDCSGHGVRSTCHPARPSRSLVHARWSQGADCSSLHRGDVCGTAAPCYLSSNKVIVIMHHNRKQTLNQYDAFEDENFLNHRHLTAFPFSCLIHDGWKGDQLASPRWLLTHLLVCGSRTSFLLRKLIFVFGWLVGFVLVWKHCIIILATFFPFPWYKQYRHPLQSVEY